MPSPLIIAGHFPPPRTGQTLATARVAELLEGHYDVHRIDLGPSVLDPRRRLAPARVWHYVRRVRALRRLLADEPDAPVLWIGVSPTRLGHLRDAYLVMPSFGPGRAVVGVLHRGTFEQRFTDPLTRASAHRLVRRLERLVVLNDALARDLAPWVPRETRGVIPNTVDAALAPAAAPERPEHTGLRLLFLSNMLPQKGYADLLEALSALPDPVTAMFVGGWRSDDERQAFLSRAAELGVDDRVDVRGPVSDPDALAACYRAADAFVLPTWHPTEAQPLVLLEALAHGLPIVTTRTGGIPDVVDAEAGAAFAPPRDPLTLAEALRVLLDPAVRRERGQRARRRFDERFSEQAVRQAWLTLLDDVLDP